MDIVVFAVGTLAAVVCAWFAFKILLGMLFAAVKLSALAALAYFAAQLTWLNADVPQVASKDVEQIVDLFENHWENFSLPAVNVRLNYDSPLPKAKLSEASLQHIQIEDAESESQYF